MSATGRGAERIDCDFYGTRPWIVHRLLDRLELPGGRWLEPTAGDGAIIRAVSSHHRYLPPASRPGLERRYRALKWMAHEIRPEGRRPIESTGALTTIGDFLTADYAPNQFDVSITNPPYALAMEVLLKLLELSPWVVLLLRLNFLGSEERSSFFRREAADIYVLPNRPSFAQSVSCSRKKLGCDFQVTLSLDVEPPRICPSCESRTRITKSDATEYGWFVWTPERGRRRGQVEVLDETPASERR